MRPSQLWIYVAIYVTLVALMLFINYSLYQYQQVFSSQADAYRSIFYQFLVFQVLILVLCGAFNTYSAINAEIYGNSYDFFRMLPLGAYQKATGILLGKNLVILLFSAINFVFFLLFGILGKVNIVLQGQFIVLLAALTLFTNSVALLSSVYSVKGKRRSNPVVLVILFSLFVVPYIMNAVYFLSTEGEDLHTYLVTFFNIKIPILLLISFIALYFSIWVIKGVARKFNREREPLFTRGGAVLFMLGLEVITLGLFYSTLLVTIKTVIPFWLINLFAVWPILLGSLRDYDNYLELSGARKARGRSDFGRAVILMLDSNVSLGIGLLLIWSVFFIGTSAYHDLVLIQVFVKLIIMFSFFMVLLLIAEIWVVYKPFYGKIGLFCLFLAGLYVFLPLILAGVMDNDAIAHYSPIGYFVGDVLFFEYEGARVLVDISVLLLNILFSTLLLVLVLKQYAGIIIVRQQNQS
jgi:hypothetical protein